MKKETYEKSMKDKKSDAVDMLKAGMQGKKSVGRPKKNK